MAVCFRPDCAEKGTKRCSKCKMVRYCGEDHQKQDWSRHKPLCGKEGQLAPSVSMNSRSVIVLGATSLIAGAIVKATLLARDRQPSISVYATSRGMLRPNSLPPALRPRTLDGLTIFGDVHPSNSSSVCSAIQRAAEGTVSVALSLPSTLSLRQACATVDAVVEACRASARNPHLVLLSSMAQAGKVGSAWGELETKVTQAWSSHTLLRLPPFIDSIWGFMPHLQREGGVGGMFEEEQQFAAVWVSEAARAAAKLLLSASPPSLVEFATTSVSYGQVVEEVRKLRGGFEVHFTQLATDHWLQALREQGYSEAQVMWAMESVDGILQTGKVLSEEEAHSLMVLDTPRPSLQEFIRSDFQFALFSQLGSDAKSTWSSVVCLQCGQPFTSSAQRRSHQDYMRHHHSLPVVPK